MPRAFLLKDEPGGEYHEGDSQEGQFAGQLVKDIFEDIPNSEIQLPPTENVDLRCMLLVGEVYKLRALMVDSPVVY